MDYLHQDLTERSIKCFYEVYNFLGYGFLEKVYEHSLMIELSRSCLNARSQVPVKGYYKSEGIGDYYADIIVNDLVMLELKAAAHQLSEGYGG
jgi:GxxExxY protein